MSELEFPRPQENLENAETLESLENRALQDATYEPGTRIEATQDYVQAEAVEIALAEAMNQAEESIVTPFIKLADHSEETRGSLPIPLPRPANDQGLADDGSAEIQNDPDHGPNPFSNSALSPDDV